MISKSTILILISTISIIQAIPFGQVFNGQASYYNDNGFGTCGTQINAATQVLVAAPVAHWTSSNPNNDPLCNNVYIKVTYQGKSITVPVKDKCPSCPANKIDLSQPAFSQLANTDLGVIPVTWEYVKGPGGSSSSSSSGGSSSGGSGGCGKKASVSQGEGCYQVWTGKCGNAWNEATFNSLNPGVNCAALQVGQQLCCGGSAGSSSSGGSSSGGKCSKKGKVSQGEGCYQVWTGKCGNAWNEATFNSLNPGVNCAALKNMSCKFFQINKLRPTQCAVGMDHVNRKVNELKALKSEESGNIKVVDFIASHPAPVVVRGDNIYLIDNHHLCRALYELGDDFFKDLPLENNTKKPIICIKVVSDLSNLNENDFWDKMKQEKWVHPFNKHGKGPLPVNEIPNKVSELEDDLFRSVAAVVKIKGGFKKTFIPYAEFQWANYFRDCWKDQKVENENFEKIIERSMQLAKDNNASHLPGYVVPNNDNNN
eukprot:gene1339-1690_t